MWPMCRDPGTDMWSMPSNVIPRNKISKLGLKATEGWMLHEMFRKIKKAESVID